MKALPFLAILFCATAIAQQPATTTDKPAPFTSIDSIGAVIPANVNMRPGGKWNVIGVEQANESVMTNARNRPATLRLKVQVFEPFKEGGWGYRIMAPDGEVSIRGTKISYRIWAYFRPDQAEALSKVHKGSTVTLSGTLGRADIKMFDGHPELSLDLQEAKVEKQ